MAQRLEVVSIGDLQRPTRGGDGTGNWDDMEKRLTIIETILPTLATKTDIADLRGDIKAGLATVPGSIAEAKSSIIMWLAAIIIAGLSATIAVTAVLINRIAPPGAAPQPIFIQMPAVPAATAAPVTAPGPPAKK